MSKENKQYVIVGTGGLHSPYRLFDDKWFAGKEWLKDTTSTKIPERYIINKGATVLFWKDGTKTIVRKSKDDKYDKRLGFLTAYFQKNSGLSRTKANKYLDCLEEE